MEKGISPIFSIILVLLISLSITALLMLFLPQATVGTFPDKSFMNSFTRSRACLNIESVKETEQKITLKNCGKIELSDLIVYIDFKPIAYYSGKLSASDSTQITYSEIIPTGYHDVFATADLTETAVMNLSFFSPYGLCQMLINSLPYSITNSNTYYCLNSDLNIGGQNAINFSSGVQSSTLDCRGYKIDGNDVGNTAGVYLTGIDTKYNTVKNCVISDFKDGIDLSFGPSSNTLINNTAYSNNNSISLSWYCSKNVINNNNINMSYNEGILLVNSSNNSILNNIVSYTVIDDGIKLSNSSYNNVSNNIVYSNYTGSVPGLGDDGIVVGDSNFTNVSSNIVYGVYGSYDIIGNSINNTFIDNVGLDSWAIFALFGTLASNNTIRGGSIGPFLPGSPVPEDYYVVTGATNYFINTNFTSPRAIRIVNYGGSVSSSGWFVYNNQTMGNIWLKTAQSGSTIPIITRKLISWSQPLMQWNDTSDLSITAYYNITGLIPNTLYYVYNNSVLTYSLSSDSSGQINFTIYLSGNQEREIKITPCNYFIFSSDIPFDITQNNSYYCLVSNVTSSALTAINFSSSVENSTLDCSGNLLNGSYTSNSYGIISKGYNSTINNCNLKSWDTAILYNNSNYGLIYNTNASSGVGVGSTVILFNSNNTKINNVNVTTDTGNYYYGFEIQSSNNVQISNTTSNVSQRALYIGSSSNTQVSDSTLLGSYSAPVDIYPCCDISRFCSHKFTNVNGANNKPILVFNNTATTIKDWYNNFSEIILCNADNSIIDNLTMTNNYGIRAWDSNNANFTNIKVSNFSYGINPLFFRFGGSNKLINVSIENSGTAIYITECYGNILNNVTAKNNSVGISLVSYTNNNNITGGLIFNNRYDYKLGYSSIGNFINTNFTGSRNISLDSTSFFNYNNETAGNIWLKTNVSAASTINRTLNYWSQSLIKWKDKFSNASGSVTAYYNITGLITNINYSVYNNGVAIAGSPFNSSSNGIIAFTINLPADQENLIMVTNYSNVINFKFNEAVDKIVHDSSGYGNDGTYYGETFNDGTSYSESTPTDLHTASGKYGNALSFDGINDYVDVANSDDLNKPNNTNQITVEGWIKLSNLSSIIHTIAFKGADEHHGFWLGPDLRSGTPHSVWWEIGDGTGAFNNCNPNFNFVVNNWYHIAGTYNGSDMKVYINGTLQTTCAPNINMIFDNADLLISRGLYSWGYVNGSLDDVRIYDRALNQTEIQADMNSYVPISRPIASYSFEEDGSATYINDTQIWVNGTYGSSLSFDGNDAVGVTNLPNSSLTVMAWIYPTQVVGDQRAIASIWGSGSEWLFRVFNDTSSPYRLQFAITNTSSSDNYEDSYSNKIININQWAHVAVTYDIQTKQVKFYKNATPEGTDTLIGNMRNSTDILRIGAQTSGSYDYFIGKIDEVRIWNRVLTQAEIQAEMSKG